ncbi:3-deoxy-manno-octulosonate cytidylyltransferase [Chryseosolibacter indicus]|uniref:3-deoxy-manno-octulosonate cytidylyltransferase n=1 Tax=Chryseosolibacter indicus TaxID=2782351 RepID=A0ABS5VTB3_9BACT|nr:3-deoxy-manno-octulosonate cytidylyltransferase [Chryseosolibacter indicus]
MTKIIGIIPARYASTRFPGKPLVDIKGKTMIQRVYEQAKKCSSLQSVIVATDDERIQGEVLNFGGEVCMTSSAHPSGTDRCAEVIEKLNLQCDAVINIQGDEPFIDPQQIELVCSCFADDRTELATLIKPVKQSEILFNPNSPKVVVDNEGFAIYFSRHPIPYLRGVDQKDWLNQHSYYQHIGIYGYRSSALRNITKLLPSTLEKAESLEQLRWIEAGLKIKTAITTRETLAIDTPDDLERILKKLQLNDL